MKPTQILSTASPNVKLLLSLANPFRGHAAAMKQLNIHGADFLLTVQSQCHYMSKLILLSDLRERSFFYRKRYAFTAKN